MEFTFSDLTFANMQRKPEEFQEIATEIRRDIIKSLTMAKSGHSGGSLGTTDLLSVLYFGDFLRYSITDPFSINRDRFVLSAGHICPVLYSVLSRAGFYPTSELASLRKLGSRLQGHPGRDTELPGIEASTGSLGQGISIAVGMAMSDKFVDNSDKRVYCLTGDGELQEGSCWEAAMTAGNYKLDNLCWIVDNNDCQIDGRVKDVMSIYPLEEKFKSFGFEVIEIDGHNYSQIQDAYSSFIKSHQSKSGKPTVIIAHTIMGKGVSFMEDDYRWHGVAPKTDEAEKALLELV